tara:strand:- start:3689 stop:3928 length:240 start_codon:yes stop_codon:yes gene_type:complete
MVDKKIEELISLYKQLISETVILKKEMIRVRGKLESNLYKTATKYNVITNDLLVVKNKYRGSVKCYKAQIDNDGHINFD